MPTMNWLKKEFSYGYQSGNILSIFPNKTRRKEERSIGGSYRRFFGKSFGKCVRPDSRVLELGPGYGSWSRAILSCIPQGELHTVDFQDVTQWLDPNQYNGRLRCFHAEDNSFNSVPDSHFDIFWSFGVLCHQNQEHLQEILSNALVKLKPGGIAIHQYADWQKLDQHGWHRRMGVPGDFQDKPDDEIWWPRNNQQIMAEICRSAGWVVKTIDLDCFERDSVVVLERPTVRSEAA
ncbi:MAG: class I SAM-dependent methyltransferase [Planctomycetes bacterium]|nr:class I SAM-dependent methyltransferase [Planctomycetota bacterium]